MSDTPEEAFEQWMKSGEYLPEVLRDFHDQKDFFKFIDIKIRQKIEKEKAQGVDWLDRYNMNGYNWVMLHILCVDYVLWFLARQGYTLQRSRKRLPFYDWDKTKNEAREEWWRQCRLMDEAREVQEADAQDSRSGIYQDGRAEQGGER